MAIGRLLLLSACGLKTDLIVYDDTMMAPKLELVSHAVEGERLTVYLNILEGCNAVFYQVDRAEVDPNCKCLGLWRRYYQSTPSEQRTGLKRVIKLRQDKEHAYRIRAVDSLGRTSDWSPTIRVK